MTRTPSEPNPSRRRWMRGTGSAGLALLALTLTGCVIAPLPPRLGVFPGPYASDPGPVVDAPPPDPQYESIPVAPGAAYVWIGGHWGFNLGRHVWIGGRWALPPSGYTWNNGYWGRYGPGWRWHGGYWRRR